MGPGVHAELGSIWPEAGALRAGTRLGRYELLLPVGAGGMACVWAGRLSGEHGFSKLVAIKTVLPFLPNQRELRAMLYDEARVAAYAHHPNVCNVLDVGEDGGVTYLVLEWVEGDSLLRLLHSKQGGPIDCDVAARIVCDACAGLHAAHEIVDETGVLLGVVHRDVSPHNLLVSIDGTTKLADFGVAKALGQQHATTRAGELRGKIGYMAPEQIAGAAVDRRSDVFALGCVLYCATTGEAPFRGDNDGAVLRAVLDGQFEPPSQLMADYPSELAAIATRAMARAPEDRFDTAEAMRAALDAWILSRGPGVSRSPVAALVETRLGARLARRREQLRATLQACLEGGTRPVRPAPMLAEGGARAALPAAPMDPPRGAEGADAGAAGATPTSRSAHERSPLPAQLTSTSFVRAPTGRALTFPKTLIAVLAGLLLSSGVLLVRSVVSARRPTIVTQPPRAVDSALAAPVPRSGEASGDVVLDDRLPAARTSEWPSAALAAHASDTVTAGSAAGKAAAPPKRARPATRGPAVSAPHSAPKPADVGGCTLNYYIDDKGKHFKPECFLKPEPGASP